MRKEFENAKNMKIARLCWAFHVNVLNDLKARGLKPWDIAEMLFDMMEDIEKPIPEPNRLSVNVYLSSFKEKDGIIKMFWLSDDGRQIIKIDFYDYT